MNGGSSNLQLRRTFNFIVLGFLVVSAVFSGNLPAARAQGPGTIPSSPQVIDAQTSGLKSAILAAIESHKIDSTDDYYYTLLSVLESGDWGIGEAERIWKDSGQIIPDDFSMILGHKETNDSWRVVLPNDVDAYLNMLSILPDALLENTTKERIRHAYRLDAQTLFSGHYLPWTKDSAALVYQNYALHGSGQLDFGFTGSIRTSKAGTLVFAYDAHTWSNCTGHPLSWCNDNYPNAWYYNNAVVIQHANGEYSAYLHLQTGSIPAELMQNCNNGNGGLCSAVNIPLGTIIGTVGSIGLSTTTHLHFGTGNLTYGNCNYPDKYDEDGDGNSTEANICTGGIVGGNGISTDFYEKPYSAPNCGTGVGQDRTLCMLYFPTNTNLISQNPDGVTNEVLAWNTFLGGSAGDSGQDITVDNNGNAYTVGWSRYNWGTPINPAAGDSYGDAFIAKVDNSGNLVWNTFIGGSGYDFGYGIATDGSGNIYVTGFTGRTWGTPVNPFAGGGDAFVAKLNSNGVVLWNTFLGGTDNDIAYAIAVDGNGNTYITGMSVGSWGTPVDPFVGVTDIFIAKLNSNGVRVWHTFLGGNDDGSDGDVGRGIAVDGLGNVYVTGETPFSWGTPVNPHLNFRDVFVAKLNSGGNIIWNTFLGRNYGDFGQGITVDGSSNIYVVGWSRDGSPGYSDVLVARLNSNNGVKVWDRLLGGGDDYGYGIAADNGNVFIVGSSVGGDAFVAELNGSGELGWNTLVGGSGNDFGNAISVDGSGKVYTTGSSDSSWGKPVNEFAGMGDAFVASFSNGNTIITLTISGNAGTNGATMSFVDGTLKTVLADGAGDYSLTVPYGWAGVVTPSKPGYTFTPPNRSYSNVQSNLSGENYTAVHVFADLPVAGKEWMEPWIVAFYQHGITTGCGTNPLIYCPENNVTRAEMAVFLLRAKHGAGYAPPAANHFFTDVPVAGKEWMQPWIEQFYREGITTGCGMNPLRYCPEQNVTRAEMAVFVLRSTHAPGWQPPASTNIFTDVPVPGKEWMQPWIEEYYREGITSGCGAGPIYCPENSTTRAEMAVFIGRAYHLYP